MKVSLMSERRFWPVFWTQFLGAFNDNLFKSAVVVMILFREASVFGVPPAQMVALTGAIFISPYLLFSAISGQISDKWDKGRVMRAVKAAEIGIMLFGAVGFWLGSVPMLLVVLFLMGTHSTVFGPCKYAILPQHLDEAELVEANALVEMGTNLAILFGTIAGTTLIAREGGELGVAGASVAVAALGLLAARFIPAAPSGNPGLRLSLDPFGPTWRLIELCRKRPSVWNSVLGISWFWAYGATFLAGFETYAKDTLGGSEALVTWFLALFSVGIGVGSIGCERLSRERLEIGLVPIGAAGMSLFTLDLFFVGAPWAAPAEPLGIAAFLDTFPGWRISLDLFGLAVFGGFMIVPLYTLVQWRTDRDETSRVIAGNNVINALFIFGGALLLAGLFAAGLDAVDVFLLFAILNTGIAIYMYTVVPEFVLRFCAFVLSRLVYRVRVEGHENIPIDDPVVFVSNHVSFVDWLILASAIKRPARFVMHKMFYDLPVGGWLFRQAKVIPIATRKEDPSIMDRAFERVHEELQDSQVVCIFPEGRITDNGELYPFKPGIEQIIARDPVPVIPIAINGLWGSFFSRRDGPAMTKPFRRWFSRVWVTIGAPVPPGEVTAAGLQDRVQDMLTSRGLPP
jgi:1-acyl-sn-glycerol-3-phosphate acyltransferase